MQYSVIDFPLRGEWKVLRPLGHHPDAIDFMKIGGDRKKYCNSNFLVYIFDRIPAENFFSWFQPVFSPIDGVVKQATDDWPDNKAISLLGTIVIWFRATFLFRPIIDGTTIDIRPNAGNYVMIQAESGEIVFLAHLRSGSIKVAIGSRVIAGQLVGEVGNSGNTTAPHLHLNLFDQMDDPLRAKVLPFVFRSYESLHGNTWKNVTNNAPTKGEVVRHNEPA